VLEFELPLDGGAGVPGAGRPWLVAGSPHSSLPSLHPRANARDLHQRDTLIPGLTGKRPFIRRRHHIMGRERALFGFATLPASALGFVRHPTWISASPTERAYLGKYFASSYRVFEVLYE
jgi:hypothetical protein